MKVDKILGLNARAAFFLPENPIDKKKYAYSKLKTKQLFLKEEIPHPKILSVLSRPERVMKFPWEDLPESFVLKPEGGNAGKGVLVIKKGAKWAGEWFTAEGEKVSIQDLRLHALDILEGKFSNYQTQGRAFIEERVPVHPIFKDYTYKGTPDVRVIVYNWVPVMAMLRLPTEASGGRANLHQGAIGVGLDIATGITTYGYLEGKRIDRHPKTKEKLNGIKIPQWEEGLKTAIHCQQAADLGFLGVDLVYHPNKGPMVLELNANPGLSIQIANMAGLRRRLERVRGLEVRSAEHGVKIAQALFAAEFADKVKAEEGLKILQYKTNLTIKANGATRKVEACINTGRSRSAISRQLAKELGLYEPEDVLWQQKTKKGSVPVVEIEFDLEGRKKTTGMKVLKSLDKRSYQVVLGRKDVSGFLISVDAE
jgi:alpha-L-glutamate ligase-like protein